MGLVKITFRQSYLLIILIIFSEQVMSIKNAQPLDSNVIEQIQVHQVDIRKRIGILSLPVKHHFGEVIETKIEEKNQNQNQDQVNDVLEFQNQASYYPQSYVKWLEDSQDQYLQIIPLEYYSITPENLPEIMQNLDGILLTGGGTAIFEKLISQKQHNDLGMISKTAQRIVSDYTNKVKDIIVQAEQINNDGRVFPIWATCLGFESMLIHYTNPEFDFTIRKNFKNNAPIQILNLDQLDDHMFNIFDQTEKQQIEQQDIHFFNHSQATLLTSIQNDTKFNEKMVITASSKIRKTGEEILAAYQAKDYPFYAVQYHPEKAGFEKFSGVIQDDLHKNLMRKYSQFFLERVQAREYQTEYDILQLFERNQMSFNNIGHFEGISLFVPSRLLK